MDNTLFDLVAAQEAACSAVTEYLDCGTGNDLFCYFLRPDRGFESHENILDYLNYHNLSPDGLYTEACAIYEKVKLGNIEPYPGVYDVFRELKMLGYPLGLVTDAENRDARLRLGKINLLTSFDSMVTFDRAKEKKPSKRPFLIALDELHVSPAETLLVGDSPRRDIEPCRDLGITTVYARYGDRFSDNRKDVGADFVIDSISGLWQVLDKTS